MAAEMDLRDEDRLPWLETVEPDDEDEPGAGRTIALVLLGLVILAAIVFAAVKIANRAPADGGGAVIPAPAGDYKVKPDDPGGLKVGGEGDSAIATSTGKDAGGAIDLKAVPEKPVATRAPEKAPAAATKGATRVATEVPAKGGKLTAAAPISAPKTSVPGAASGGSLVQLGAFPSEAAANAAWSAMAKRFAYIATLGKSVEGADVGGKKVFRLRVNAGSANAASDICGRLKVAGESCFVTAG